MATRAPRVCMVRPEDDPRFQEVVAMLNDDKFSEMAPMLPEVERELAMLREWLVSLEAGDRERQWQGVPQGGRYY